MYYNISDCIQQLEEVISFNYYCDQLHGIIPIFVKENFLSNDIIYYCKINIPIQTSNNISEISKSISNLKLEKWLELNYPEKLSEIRKRVSIIQNPKKELPKKESFLEIANGEYFAGNYKMQGKEYIEIDYGKEPNKKDIYLKQISPSAYDFPYSYRSKIKDFENNYYSSSVDIKEKHFNNLTDSEKHQTLISFFKSCNRTILEQGNYVIYISGNDDEIWKKYFWDEQDMLNELYYLNEVSKQCGISKEYDMYGKDYIMM